MDYLSVVVRWLDLDSIPAVYSANDAQRHAIHHSLVHSFSLIHGAPGTGKTVTAVQLAGLFVRINRSLPVAQYDRHNIRPQLMICAPTDSSLDIITSQLKFIVLINTFTRMNLVDSHPQVSWRALQGVLLLGVAEKPTHFSYT